MCSSIWQVICLVWHTVNSWTHLPDAGTSPNYDAFLSVICCFLVVTSFFEYARKRITENLNVTISLLLRSLSKDGDEKVELEMVEYLSGRSECRKKAIEEQFNKAFHSYMVHSLWVYLVVAAILFSGASPYLGILNFASTYPIIITCFRLRKIYKNEDGEMKRNKQNWEGHRDCEDFKKDKASSQEEIKNALNNPHTK